MFDFTLIYNEVKKVYNEVGRDIMIAGETDSVWIFKGTPFKDGKNDMPIIVDKKDKSMRSAHILLDNEVFKTATVLIDNR